MAKFITGNELNSELEKLLETAESQIFLISPYIKLHDRLKSVLLAKKENYNLEIVLVFGKNEEDKSKSLKSNDLEFFKEFPNIEIHYEKRLHAKYYANEKNSILTSMNLYSFSQDNNIEFGVLIEYSFKNKILGNSSLDINAFNYFVRVIEQADLIYKKTPQFESSTLGLTKKYKGSIVEIDNTNSFFKEGKKIATYRFKDLVVRPKLVRESTSHIRWVAKINPNSDGSLPDVLELETTSFRQYRFETLTGKMLSGGDSPAWNRCRVIASGIPQPKGSLEYVLQNPDVVKGEAKSEIVFSASDVPISSSYQLLCFEERDGKLAATERLFPFVW